MLDTGRDSVTLSCQSMIAVTNLQGHGLATQGGHAGPVVDSLQLASLPCARRCYHIPASHVGSTLQTTSQIPLSWSSDVECRKQIWFSWCYQQQWQWWDTWHRRKKQLFSSGSCLMVLSICGRNWVWQIDLENGTIYPHGGMQPVSIIFGAPPPRTLCPGKCGNAEEEAVMEMCLTYGGSQRMPPVTRVMWAKHSNQVRTAQM